MIKSDSLSLYEKYFRYEIITIFYAMNEERERSRSFSSASANMLKVSIKTFTCRPLYLSFNVLFSLAITCAHSYLCLKNYRHAKANLFLQQTPSDSPVHFLRAGIEFIILSWCTQVFDFRVVNFSL